MFHPKCLKNPCKVQNHVTDTVRGVRPTRCFCSYFLSNLFLLSHRSVSTENRGVRREHGGYEAADGRRRRNEKNAPRRRNRKVIENQYYACKNVRYSARREHNAAGAIVVTARKNIVTVAVTIFSGNRTGKAECARPGAP